MSKNAKKKAFFSYRPYIQLDIVFFFGNPQKKVYLHNFRLKIVEAMFVSGSESNATTWLTNAALYLFFLAIFQLLYRLIGARLA